MESKLSKLPVKVLIEISNKLLEDSYDFENPYDIGYEESAEILEDATAWIGLGGMESLDIEFMARFLYINEGLLRLWNNGAKNQNDFIIPKPKKFIVNYSSKGRGYVTQNYSTDWTSYDEDWVKDSMSQLSSAGDWSCYDGDYHGTEVDDFDEDDLDIDSIRESSNQRNESILDKLIIENTSEVVNSLDKDTLLKLKSIINSRLSSL